MLNSMANLSSSFFFIRHFLLLIVCIITLTLSVGQRSFSHEISPAIAELSIKENIVEINFYFSVEIFLADIDASIITDTNETNKSEVYDDLRARDSAEIENIFKSKSNTFIDLITVKSEQEMLQVKFLDIKVSENRDVTIPRESKITLSVATKTDDVKIIFGWDKKLGPLIVRQVAEEEYATQNDTEYDLYSSYLSPGELSAPIVRGGVLPVSSVEIIKSYLVIGFEHIIPKGLDHILFVLGLYLFATKVSQLILQVSIFTIAHTITLAMASLGYVKVPAIIVEPLIALSISYVALETLWHTKIGWSRLLIIFGFGLLHGLGFASVLMDIGLNPTHFITGLISFNIGVEFGQLAVIIIAYLAIGITFSKTRFYRPFIQIPLSLIIASIGGWWFVERIFL